MGCDIHIVMHKKIDGEWTRAIPEDRQGVICSEPRDYDLFARLANIRNQSGIQPICEPRGLPDDIAYRARHDSYDDDYSERVDGKYIGEFGYSWLLLSDIRRALNVSDIYNINFVQLFWELQHEAWQVGDTINEIRAGKRDDEIRIVFGFDA